MSTAATWVRRVGVLCVLAAASGAMAHAPVERKSPRRIGLKDVGLKATRTVLPNGLTVILSPDPTVSSVVVDVSFHAGAIYEPPGRNGLAHLVEHMMMSGRTPETRYLELLEARGGFALNAVTTFDLMTFRAIVPPGELPLAVWVAADRLGTLPAELDEADVARHRKVVLEERRLRLVDEPFGRAEIVRFQHLFPEPHPLGGMVVGTEKSLAAITLADVRAFIERCLVPANGVITIVGNFDPAAAEALIEERLGTLPGGARVPPPKLRGWSGADKVSVVKEPFSRRPRVSMGWALDQLAPRQLDALALGSVLLAVYTDGSFGTDVAAAAIEFQGGALFALDVTLPHDKTQKDARDDAESFLRFLTRAPVPYEVFDATQLAIDRAVLATLDSPSGRARLLTWLESRGIALSSIARFNSNHWTFSREEIHQMARDTLENGKIVLHVRPLRPRPPRLERGE